MSLRHSEHLLQHTEHLLRDAEQLLRETEMLLHRTEKLLRGAEMLLHRAELLVRRPESQSTSYLRLVRPLKTSFLAVTTVSDNVPNLVEQFRLVPRCLDR